MSQYEIHTVEKDFENLIGSMTPQMTEVRR